MIPSGEAVCSVPNTLVAICLNTGGLTKVSESGALDCFVPILTSKRYLKALQGDTPSVLGAGLDELLRHVTTLRKDGVSMILQVFRTLCAEGGVLLCAHAMISKEWVCFSWNEPLLATLPQGHRCWADQY